MPVSLRPAACLVAAALLAAGPAPADMTVAGVTLPRAARLEAHELTLRSCGVRDTLWVEHYVAALYLPSGQPPIAAIQDPRQAKLLRVQIVTAAFLPAEIPERWQAPLAHGFQTGPMAHVRAAYSRLQAGDAVTLAYVPDRGAALYVNDRVVATAPGHGLIDAVLQAWADGDPVAGKLQRVLLRHPC